MRLTILTGLIAAIAVGCDRGGPEVPSPENVPLTKAEWQQLPPNEKYQIVTFERLKVGNPDLYDSRKWDKYYRTEILPQRKKDHAAIKNK